MICRKQQNNIINEGYRSLYINEITIMQLKRQLKDYPFRLIGVWGLYIMIVKIFL